MVHDLDIGVVQRLLQRFLLPVQQRADDTADAIMRRLSIYDEQTAPLLNFYKEQDKLVTVDGDRDVASVSADIVQVISDAGVSA